MATASTLFSAFSENVFGGGKTIQLVRYVIERKGVSSSLSFSPHARAGALFVSVFDVYSTYLADFHQLFPVIALSLLTCCTNVEGMQGYLAGIIALQNLSKEVSIREVSSSVLDRVGEPQTQDPAKQLSCQPGSAHGMSVV